MKYNIVSWWSGGVTSAIACKLSIDIFGIDNVDFIFIDTYNEDDDTYRFKKDCEKWWGKKIETISAIPEKWKNIEEIWYHYKSLNVATGAICSTELKRYVRERWQKQNEFNHQVFGFDFSETKRAISISKNHADTKAIFPLLLYGLVKQDCYNMLIDCGIKPPAVYDSGYLNNNCFKTGCTQGGIGYWQKIQRDDPEKFRKMAKREHELTDLRGEPVTMLKDQSMDAMKFGSNLVFLLPHPDYPMIKDLSMMEGRKPKPLFECNGFCTTNDLDERNPTEKEINFQTQINFD